MITCDKTIPAAPTVSQISLVVACRNEAKHIRLFLDSLLAQDLDGFDWQIVVADGASDDGTRQVLEEYASGNSRITVIDNPAKIVSCGLNSAIRAARGSIILRMDAHTEYAPDYVKKCVDTLERSAADNTWAVPHALEKAEGLRPRAIEAAYHSRFSTGGARFHDDNHSGYVDTVPYGCWRKETLLRLGLFDEALVRNQDDELNLRLTRSGGKIWQSAEIVSWYRPRTNLSALFRQYFQYGFWKVRVIRKHRIPGSWRHLIPGLFVAVNLLLLLTSACAAIAGSSAVARAALLTWVTLAVAYSAACVMSFIARRPPLRLVAAFVSTFHIRRVSFFLRPGISHGLGLLEFCEKGAIATGRFLRGGDSMSALPTIPAVPLDAESGEIERISARGNTRAVARKFPPIFTVGDVRQTFSLTRSSFATALRVSSRRECFRSRAARSPTSAAAPAAGLWSSRNGKPQVFMGLSWTKPGFERAQSSDCQRPPTCAWELRDFCRGRRILLTSFRNSPYSARF